MKETPLLKLKLPETTEYVLVSDINENMEKIDTEVIKINNEITKISDPKTGVAAELTTHLDEIMPHKYVGNGNKIYRWGLGEDSGGIYFAREEVI